MKFPFPIIASSFVYQNSDFGSSCLLDKHSGCVISITLNYKVLMGVPMDIESIIRSYRTIAVVGLSPKPGNPGYGIAAFLKTVGFKIVPVSPNTDEILEERTYSALKDIPFPVDIVQVFQPADAIGQTARDAIDIEAKVLWLQEGIVSSEAEEICADAGMDVVMDRCLLKEYRRLLGRLMAGGAG